MELLFVVDTTRLLVAAPLVLNKQSVASQPASLEDGDEVNSFRTGGGVLMVRGAYGLPTISFAPRLEDRSLGFDLSRSVPKLQRTSKSKSCKLCGSKTHEEGECANTAQSRCGAQKHGMLSLQGHKCCSWIYLFEKNLVDKIGKPLQMKKKRKQ